MKGISLLETAIKDIAADKNEVLKAVHKKGWTMIYRLHPGEKEMFSNAVAGPSGFFRYRTSFDPAVTNRHFNHWMKHIHNAPDRTDYSEVSDMIATVLSDHPALANLLTQ